MVGLVAASVVPGGASAQDSEQDTSFSAERKYCSTRALDLHSLAAGAKSEIVCFRSMSEAFAAQGSSIDQYPELAAKYGSGEGESLQMSSDPARVASDDPLWAAHLDWDSVFSPVLSVFGSLPCNQGGVDLSGDPWNDMIEVTIHVNCGQIKHWLHGGYTGATQVTSGGSGVSRSLNGTLANQVTSMRYQ
jgi:hypothetical protein